ncbi:MAG: transcription antitermination factor NusB [Candidatus Eisenbacteria bacterium]|nr:transcription antitermination factor NusB [Candidatus Eisenbacteria bacterium]
MDELRERRRLRELGVRTLYQAEVVGEDLPDALENVLAHSRRVSEPGRTYLEAVLRSFEEHRAAIDAALESQAEHWSLKRMAATDRNVLRWAATELWFRPDVPRAVVLDEAIELAKELSGSESGKFVNGILDRLPASLPGAGAWTGPADVPEGGEGPGAESPEPRVESKQWAAPPGRPPGNPPGAAPSSAASTPTRDPGLKIAIFSDIHGNLDALEAVLAEVRAAGIRRMFCLGDVVGYGASPNECCALVAEVSEDRVLGNHDEACLGRGNLEYFNSVARMAALWTQKTMDGPTREYLETAPMTLALDAGPLPALLVHASPYCPDEWHYVLSEHDARAAFDACRDRLVFVGHSHVPGVFDLAEDGKVTAGRGAGARLEPGHRYLVNVGSVGQPRDGDPRASWCALDPEAGTVEIRRVAYDIARAQSRIRDARLPEILASRLAWGE